VTYQPERAGQRDRTALFDTSIIPDPENWLAKSLGPRARFEVTQRAEHVDAADGEVKALVHSDTHDESKSASNAPDKNPAAGEQAGARPPRVMFRTNPQHRRSRHD
jgi:hypothetical protein